MVKDLNSLQSCAEKHCLWTDWQFSHKVSHKVVIHDPSLHANTTPLVDAPFILSLDNLTCYHLTLLHVSSKIIPNAPQSFFLHAHHLFENSAVTSPSSLRGCSFLECCADLRSDYKHSLIVTLPDPVKSLPYSFVGKFQMATIPVLANIVTDTHDVCKVLFFNDYTDRDILKTWLRLLVSVAQFSQKSWERIDWGKV